MPVRAHVGLRDHPLLRRDGRFDPLFDHLSFVDEDTLDSGGGATTHTRPRGAAGRNSAMRGRQWFTVMKPAFSLAGAALNAVPAGAVSPFLVATRGCPGKAGAGVRYLFLRRLCKRCGNVVAV